MISIALLSTTTGLSYNGLGLSLRGKRSTPARDELSASGPGDDGCRGASQVSQQCCETWKKPVQAHKACFDTDILSDPDGWAAEFEKGDFPELYAKYMARSTDLTADEQKTVLCLQAAGSKAQHDAGMGGIADLCSPVCQAAFAESADTCDDFAGFDSAIKAKSGWGARNVFDGLSSLCADQPAAEAFCGKVYEKMTWQRTDTKLPLPEGWVAQPAGDGTGREYYVNTKTLSTTWARPGYQVDSTYGQADEPTPAAATPVSAPPTPSPLFHANDGDLPWATDGADGCRGGSALSDKCCATWRPAVEAHAICADTGVLTHPASWAAEHLKGAHPRIYAKFEAGGALSASEERTVLCLVAGGSAAARGEGMGGVRDTCSPACRAVFDRGLAEGCPEHWTADQWPEGFAFLAGKSVQKLFTGLSARLCADEGAAKAFCAAAAPEVPTLARAGRIGDAGVRVKNSFVYPGGEFVEVQQAARVDAKLNPDGVGWFWIRNGPKSLHIAHLHFKSYDAVTKARGFEEGVLAPGDSPLFWLAGKLIPVALQQKSGSLVTPERLAQLAAVWDTTQP